MTDLQRHIASVHDNPADKTAALALADHLQEVNGYTRWVALRKVATIRRAKWNAEQMAHASAMLRHDSIWHQWLKNVIAASVGISAVQSLTVLVRPGRYHPTRCWNEEPHSRGFWRGPVVTVGASWVLNVVAAQLVEPRMPPGWQALLEDM